MKNKILVGLLIAVFCFMAGYIIKGTSTPTVIDDSPYGGAVHNILETFDAGIAVDGKIIIDGEGRLIQSGDHLTITSGSWSPTAAQLCDSSVITHDCQASGNVTLPTAATLIADCIPDPGDHFVVFFENTNTSSQLDTLVAGTTMDLLAASGSEQAIGADERALIHFYNIDNASVSASVIELGDTD